jgi:hypothetical protein
VTIVLGAVTDTEICMLADSRITWTSTSGPILNTRDVVQKLFVPQGGWSLLGWAGNLCLARDIVRALFNRLNATEAKNPQWLRSDDTIKKFVRSCIALHADGKPNHKVCQRKSVQFMIAWLDYGKNPFSQDMEVLTIHSPGLSVRRTSLGVDIIGSGETILNLMRFESFMEIMWRYRDQEKGHITRTLYCAGEAAKHLRRTKELTVGGLFQIAVLSSKGAQPLDHFQLVPIAEGRFGTYVAMRTRAGMWLQEHRPTGSIVKIEAPFDIELKGPRAREPKIFDQTSQLTKDSPGVIEFSDPYVMDFCLYDPDDVPSEVRRSWGDDRLESLSWAQGPVPKRWHR